MVDLVAIGIQTVLFAAVLAGFLLAIRFRMTKWVSLGFARMIKSFQDQDAEAGVGPTPGGGQSGEINLGGFKIDVGTIRELLGVLPEIMKAVKMLQSTGLLGGGGGGGGTPNPFLK